MTGLSLIIRSILDLRPGAEWTMDGDDLSTLVWLDKQQARPTDAEIVAHVPPPPDPLSSWDAITLKIAFNHENRLRAIEGKAAITVAQFKTAIRAML